MTSDQKAKIAELRAAGFGYANIAKTLGLTKNQVVSFCHRNGLAGEKSTQVAKDKPEIGVLQELRKAHRPSVLYLRLLRKALHGLREPEQKVLLPRLLHRRALRRW
jgi:hypothetical protein